MLLKRIIILCLFFPALAFAVENLDEYDTTRGARRGSNTYYHGGTSGNSYVRQPEMLCYTDTTTDALVCIMTSTPNNSDILHTDISPAYNFSADGKRIGFFSERSTSAFSKSGNSSLDGTQAIGFVMRSDGTQIRVLNDASERGWGSQTRFYWAWNPAVPDIFYAFGGDTNGRGLNRDDLYQNTVSDDSISYLKIIDFPSGEYFILKQVSGGGTRIIANEGETTYLPATVYPSGSAALLDADGWSNDRGHAGYYGGSGPIPNAHDQYFPSPTGEWFALLISGSYRLMQKYDVTGTDGDGGPDFNTSATYDAWDDEECEPMAAWIYGTMVPWDPDGNISYHGWGHPAFDRWGRCVSFQDGDSSPIGSVTWDYQNREYVVSGGTTATPSQGTGCATHGDWSAWSDYVIVSCANNNYVMMFPYNLAYTATTKDRVVAYHYGDVNNDNDYHWDFSRPQQSPDGTKVAYAVSFPYNTANAGTFANAVAYYPYPPEITAVSATGGVVTVTFDWQHDDVTPANRRTYTARGWPDEGTDDSPPPREVEKFRLWYCTTSCSDTTGNWTPLTTIDHNIFARYDFSDGTWDGNDYWTVDFGSGDATYYIALTSVEWSGLESRALSNIYEVIIASGACTDGVTCTEDVAYPSSPGDLDNISTSDFYNAYSASNTELIRYYNIYAQDGSAPTLDQTNLIASISVNHCVAGDCEWVDWLGNTGGTTVYRMAPVDTQGNPGVLFTPTFEHQKSPATAAGQYTIEWTTPSGDLDPPVVGSGLPSGVQSCPGDPISVTLKVTNSPVDASLPLTCYYCNDEDSGSCNSATGYTWMAANGTLMTQNGNDYEVTGVSHACDDGYVRYVSCKDDSNNEMALPATINFSVVVGPEVCDQAGDEDNDGLDSCADPDCDTLEGPSGETCEYQTELTCDDTYDNDGKGDGIDCLDSDCLFPPASNCAQRPSGLGGSMSFGGS